MSEDENGWHIDFDQAVAVVVELVSDEQRAAVILEDSEGQLGVWEFEDFPVDDFMDAGLNIIGPWLNARGLAYASWQTTGPNQETAVLYRYDGSGVDPRVVARRSA